jgi:putative ABC transport system ATP-binding protein
VDNKVDQRTAISVKGVAKTFGSGEQTVFAVKEAHLEAREGELLMIVGPSGCGKTTLISLIAGILRPTKGSVEIFSTNLYDQPDHKVTEFRKKHLGFVFQQYHLINTLTCLENISIPLLLNGVAKKEAEERAFELLEKVGLQGKERVLPKKLSGGQQQRVAIARALVHNPSIVVCDEPTAALDADTGAKIVELLIAVGRMPGRCVVVVTHDSRIFHYADRIAKMDDGRIVSVKEN